MRTDARATALRDHTPETAPPERGGCIPRMARSRPRPSSRSRPRRRCAALEAREVAGLGYELVLGNTYHLLLSPGPERIAQLGGLHGFMGWERAIITDSGGFQVFSLAHGAVADEIKGRRDQAPGPTARARDLGAGGPLSLLPRRHASTCSRPRRSMEVQAALGSDIALVFDECTPYHADRDYTARSTERTHRWLDRCLEWHERARDRRARRSSGSSRAASMRTCGASRPSAVARGRRSTGSRSAARSAATRRRCTRCSAMTAPLLPDEAPKHLLGIGEVDDLLERDRARARRLRLRGPDPARPPRRRPRARAPSSAAGSTCRPLRGDRDARWSRAAPARPARATTATTSATSRAPRS